VFILLLSFNLKIDGPRRSPDEVGFLIVLSSGIILFVLFLLVVKFVFYHKVALIKSKGVRADFGQNLDDITTIVGERSTLELRAYAMRLLEDDVKTLSEALDTLQYTMLGLQPVSHFKWRCPEEPFDIGVPFEIVKPGRLEGEIKALGKTDQDDARECGRKLKRRLEQSIVNTSVLASFSQASLEESPAAPRLEQSLARAATADRRALHSSRSDILKTGMRDRIGSMKASVSAGKSRVTGITQVVQQCFKCLDGNGDGKVTETEFVTGMRSGFNEERDLTERELRIIFRYIDINRDGRLDLVEFAHWLQNMCEPFEITGGSRLKRPGAPEEDKVEPFATPCSVQTLPTLQ
jgi:hypothetical protein